MPTPERLDQLMLKTAEQLKEGKKPLNGTFLADNDVTADECFQLADLLVSAIHTYRATASLMRKATECERISQNGANATQRLAASVVKQKIYQSGPFAVFVEATRLEAEAHD